MKKIPTMFVRDLQNPSHITSAVATGCEWVLAGEGRATRKFDGTCCLVRDGVLYKRREIKLLKPIPPEWFPADGCDEPVNGKFQGWMPLDENDKWHRHALADFRGGDGTYELCGSKVQGDPEGLGQHVLLVHGAHVLYVPDRSFDGLRQYFQDAPCIEGIVFHHPDGRMAKIKLRDFGIKRS